LRFGGDMWVDCAASFARAREGKLIKPCTDGPACVPLMVGPAAASAPVGTMTQSGVIRIEIADSVHHVAPDCSPDHAAALAAVLKRAL